MLISCLQEKNVYCIISKSIYITFFYRITNEIVDHLAMTICFLHGKYIFVQRAADGNKEHISMLQKKNQCRLKLIIHIWHYSRLIDSFTCKKGMKIKTMTKKARNRERKIGNKTENGEQKTENRKRKAGNRKRRTGK